jgi:hypothetical protein
MRFIKSKEKITEEKCSDMWLLLSQEEKDTFINDLKCEKHSAAKFLLLDNGRTDLTFSYPMVQAICDYCKLIGINKTIYTYCRKCGFILDKPIIEHYNSPEWTWRSLCGRRGIVYHCGKCGSQVGYNYWMIS